MRLLFEESIPNFFEVTGWSILEDGLRYLFVAGFAWILSEAEGVSRRGQEMGQENNLEPFQSNLPSV